jgi:cell division protein FtsW (lipid II flippase)
LPADARAVDRLPTIGVTLTAISGLMFMPDVSNTALIVALTAITAAKTGIQWHVYGGISTS